MSKLDEFKYWPSPVRCNVKSMLLLHRALPLLFLAAVLLVSLLAVIPSSSVPKVFQFWDKAQHSLAYTGLSIIGYFAFPKRLVFVFFGLLVHGALIEVIQSTLTTTRFGETLDWIADSVGILIGLSVYFLIIRKNVTIELQCQRLLNGAYKAKP